jgi:ATP-dependent Clp protease ATP-binding subunit ClpC
MNWLKKFWVGLTEPMPLDPASKKRATAGNTPNFTPRAQQVFTLARKEAGRLNHNFVGTEHVLLGIIALGQGTAFTVLAKLGLDLETVRIKVEKYVGTGPDQKVIGNIPYAPRVK